MKKLFLGALLVMVVYCLFATAVFFWAHLILDMDKTDARATGFTLSFFALAAVVPIAAKEFEI